LFTHFDQLFVQVFNCFHIISYFHFTIINFIPQQYTILKFVSEAMILIMIVVSYDVFLMSILVGEH